jgi:purine nucleoside permease
LRCLKSAQIPVMFRASSNFGWSGANWITLYRYRQAYHDVRADGNGPVGTVTGMGTAKAAASIMALGLDPRFDFSQAYWLVAGIAGIDPNRGTVGSAVWADYVLDGDLAHEIDAREIPKGWVDGFTPLGQDTAVRATAK